MVLFLEAGKYSHNRAIHPAISVEFSENDIARYIFKSALSMWRVYDSKEIDYCVTYIKKKIHDALIAKEKRNRWYSYLKMEINL